MARFWKTDAEGRVNPLVPDWVYFVEVSGFTFSFRSLEHIEEYLEHFSLKIHPTSADGADRPLAYFSKDNNGNESWEYSCGSHWERQSRFDELPLWLFEEPKRLKVVKALQRAIEKFEKQNGAPPK